MHISNIYPKQEKKQWKNATEVRSLESSDAAGSLEKGHEKYPIILEPRLKGWKGFFLAERTLLLHDEVWSKYWNFDLVFPTSIFFLS